jgi:hypothetical protein
LARLAAGRFHPAAAQQVALELGGAKLGNKLLDVAFVE